MNSRQQRELWNTKVGLVFALAGNAVGLGNMLRFPVQAAQNGGGTFMIPYFISLLLLGIPLMWVELAIGRRGGRFGYGTTPGMFGTLWAHPLARYVGAFGVLIPSVIFIYYAYVVSWTLGFSFFSAAGSYMDATTRDAMGEFFNGYLGLADSTYFGSIAAAYFFFLVTVALNIWILSRGVVKGIEDLAKVAMPILLILGVVLVARVLTLGTPDPMHPDWNVSNGLGFIWNPDLARLVDAKVWMAAAGQIFFTLSLGMGSLQTYASYIREKQDLALTGLATTSVNQSVEVIIGGTLAIPAAVVFFGATQTREIAEGGAFSLGFMSLPVIFQQIPGGAVFGCLWFMLLFVAGITSSVAMAQPAMAFMQDEFGLTRKRAALWMGGALFVLSQPVIFFMAHGFLDELDYWVGTFGLVVVAFMEVILFAWVFGMDRGWKEITSHAEIKIPRLFYIIIRYVTPIYLAILLVWWGYTDALPVLLMEGVDPADVPYKWGARLLLAGLLLLILFGIRHRWRDGGDPTEAARETPGNSTAEGGAS